nr:hypothetical protein [Tanacetum cinerariifolium]
MEVGNQKSVDDTALEAMILRNQTTLDADLQIAPDANPLPVEDVDLEIKSKILRPFKLMDVDTFINPVDADLEVQVNAI